MMPWRLADMRVRAERRMRDSCRVSAPAPGGGALDPDTWLPASSAGSVIYEGPCRLRMMGRAATSGQGATQVAGDLVVTSTPLLHIPVSAPRVPVGAVVLITGVPPDDPAGHLRLNLRLRVTGLIFGTDTTSQRVTLETVTG